MSEVYWLFVTEKYEEGGGMDDFEGVFSTLEELKECVKSNKWNVWPKYATFVKVVDGFPVLTEDLDEEV